LTSAAALALTTLVLSSACKAPPSPSSSGGGDAGSAHAAAPVVVTVNGTPITETEVALRLKSDSHATELTPDARKNVIETLVRDELVYQRGVALGLDADPSYREEVARAEQLAALKRRKMGDLFYAHELAAKGDIEDDVVRKYVQDHAKELGTELHVLQILRRDRAGIDQAKTALDHGTAFEEVARAPFKDVAVGSAPWDLGFMRWAQLPIEWRETVGGMKEGDVSPVITGQKDRFWILKLVARRHVEVSFDAEKPALVELLRGEQLAARHAEIEKKLHEGASIVYTTR
jgi:peptidyl-prolyl cis-trans isomerase C